MFDLDQWGVEDLTVLGGVEDLTVLAAANALAGRMDKARYAMARIRKQDGRLGFAMRWIPDIGDRPGLVSTRRDLVGSR
jgi:hypothetical protein